MPLAPKSNTILAWKTIATNQLLSILQSVCNAHTQEPLLLLLLLHIHFLISKRHKTIAFIENCNLNESKTHRSYQPDFASRKIIPVENKIPILRAISRLFFFSPILWLYSGIPERVLYCVFFPSVRCTVEIANTKKWFALCSFSASSVLRCNCSDWPNIRVLEVTKK